MIPEGLPTPPPEEVELAERLARGCVFVVDDDADVLAAVVETVTLEGYACEGYTTAKNFLDQFCAAEYQDTGPACLLCDVKLPGLGGLDLQDRLKALRELPVLLMSGDSGALEAAKAFRAGAVDFLIKPLDADQLLRAVSQGLVISAARRADRVRATALSDRVAQLSLREREVATLVVSGQTNSEVAERMGIGLRTVKLHRHQAMLKLGAHTLADLVRIVDEAGL